MWTRDQDVYWEQRALDQEQHDAYGSAGRLPECPCPQSHPKKAEEHHPDCDYRNSTAQNEAAEALGVPEDRTEIYPCNLNCETED